MNKITPTTIKGEKESVRKGSICERLVEKCLEWLEYLKYRIFRRKEKWCSHLTEYYCIHRNYYEQNFVKDFLLERENILGRNKHRMAINIIPDDSDPQIVGKVLLYNKSKYIHEATLKIKLPLSGSNIIFWSFDKKENRNNQE